MCINIAPLFTDQNNFEISNIEDTMYTTWN